MNSDYLLDLLNTRKKYVEKHYNGIEQKTALFEIETLIKVVLKSEKSDVKRVRMNRLNTNTLF